MTVFNRCFEKVTQELANPTVANFSLMVLWNQIMNVLGSEYHYIKFLNDEETVSYYFNDIPKEVGIMAIMTKDEIVTKFNTVSDLVSSCITDSSFNSVSELMAKANIEVNLVNFSAFAILHEIGHVLQCSLPYETLNDLCISNEEQLEKIFAQLDAKEISELESHCLYRSLPMESDADNFAVKTLPQIITSLNELQTAC